MTAVATAAHPVIRLYSSTVSASEASTSTAVAAGPEFGQPLANGMNTAFSSMSNSDTGLLPAVHIPNNIIHLPGLQPQPPNPQHQPFFQRPGLRFKTNVQNKPDDMAMGDGPGRRLRKNVANVRKHIDYIANAVNHIDSRLWQYSKRDRLAVQPDILYHSTVLPPSSTEDIPVDCVLTKFVRSAMNKVKSPVYTLCWSPEGKRLITGTSSGEFTLWNGTAFNFETILQAHDVAIRALKWSHNDQWLVSADHEGYVKYWQPNMNNVHMFHAHRDEPIRSLSFCPTDVKFATASDDATARIWDFARCAEERVLRGHGADVRSVDWHPTKGLLATGSRDSQQPVKLWDAKTGQCLATLHDHKNSVMAVQWNQNGNWLLTGSRDHMVKLYDVRMMKEVQSFRAHKKEVTSLAWHPVHEGLFVSGGGDGSLGYWMVNNKKELALLDQAHDQAIWTLEWHPLGHILATGSNDNNTKFWARNRPGDTQEDIYGLTPYSWAPTGILTSTAALTVMAEQNQTQNVSADDAEAAVEEPQRQVPIIPGMGLDEDAFEMINRDLAIPMLPGLGGNSFFEPQAGQKKGMMKQPPPKKAQRQFERMWMVSRPSGPGPDDFGDGRNDQMDAEGYGAFGPPSGGPPKASLLGPRPSLLSMPPQQQKPPGPGGPGVTQPPLGPPPSFGGPPPLQNTTWRQPPQPQQLPPNGALGINESWKPSGQGGGQISEDIDLRMGSIGGGPGRGDYISEDVDMRMVSQSGSGRGGGYRGGGGRGYQNNSSAEGQRGRGYKRPFNDGGHGGNRGGGGNYRGSSGDGGDRGRGGGFRGSRGRGGGFRGGGEGFQPQNNNNPGTNARGGSSGFFF